MFKFLSHRPRPWRPALSSAHPNSLADCLAMVDATQLGEVGDYCTMTASSASTFGTEKPCAVIASIELIRAPRRFSSHRCAGSSRSFCKVPDALQRRAHYVQLPGVGDFNRVRVYSARACAVPAGIMASLTRRVADSTLEIGSRVLMRTSSTQRLETLPPGSVLGCDPVESRR
jgi:hypothetical protein